MTLDEVFQALRGRYAGMVVRDGALVYVGTTPLAPDDPLRAGISEHRAMLIELFTYAPNGRCVAAGCYRLRAGDTAATCPDHLPPARPAPMAAPDGDVSQPARVTDLTRDKTSRPPRYVPVTECRPIYLQ